MSKKILRKAAPGEAQTHNLSLADKCRVQTNCTTEASKFTEDSDWDL